MPMIDVYAATGTFSDKHKLAQDLANAVIRWEKVPPIKLFQNNTAAFVHELPPEAISNAAGESNYVRVQVLTPVAVLDREKQLGVVRELTDIVAAAAKDASVSNRTWVLITESPEGGADSNSKTLCRSSHLDARTGNGVTRVNAESLRMKALTSSLTTLELSSAREAR